MLLCIYFTICIHLIVHMLIRILFIHVLHTLYLITHILITFLSIYTLTHICYTFYIHIGFTDYNEEIVILLIRACIRCNDVTTISTLLLQYKYNISAWMTATSYHLLVSQLLKEAVTPATSAAVTPATSEVRSEDAQATGEGEQHLQLLVNVSIYLSLWLSYTCEDYFFYEDYSSQVQIFCTHLYILYSTACAYILHTLT